MKLFNNIMIWFLLMLTLFTIGASMYFLYQYVNSISFSLLISFYFINLIITWILFLQKRQTIEKISWLFLFVSIPFLGHIIFLLFGQKYKFRISRKEYYKKEDFNYEEKTKPKFQDKDIENIMQKISKLSHRSIYDSDIEYFSNGAYAIEKLFEDLKNAKKFIHLQFYIVKPGEVFEELKSILLKKVKEGIKIRMLIDDFGRWALPWYEIKLLKKEGIEIVIFGKVYFPFIGSYNGYRMHRKIFIIDGEICHTGGINIGDEYVNWSKKYGFWIDYQIKIIGKGIRTNSLLFLELWNSISKKKLDYKNYLNEKKCQKTSQILTIEDSPETDESLVEWTLINLILSAKKTITLVTPYLIPTEKLIEAIKIASLSGIKVKIFIPGRADKKFVLIGSEYYSKLLMKYNVKIYRTNNIFIHTKFGLFDNKYAYVGSANLDSRTFFYQWESIQITNGKIIESFKNEIKEYEKISSLLKNSDFKRNRIKNFIIKTYVNILTPIM